MKRYSYRSKRKPPGITTVLSGVKASSQANMSSANENNRDFSGSDVTERNHSYLLGRLYIVNIGKMTLALSLSLSLSRSIDRSISRTMNIYILSRIGPRCVLSKENPTTLNHVTMWVNKYLEDEHRLCISYTVLPRLDLENGMRKFKIWGFLFTSCDMYKNKKKIKKKYSKTLNIAF